VRAPIRLLAAILLFALAACGARTGDVPPTRDASLDAPRSDAPRSDAAPRPDLLPLTGWACSAGGGKNDWGRSIAVDGQGNAYVTGHFEGTASFGPHTLHAAGASDMFLAKVSPDGQFLWAVRAGGAGEDRGCGVIVDDVGRPMVTGLFHDAITFGAVALSSKGLADLFVARYSTDGDPQWAVRGGSGGADWGWDLSPDGQGGAFLAGQYNGQGSFGSATLPAMGSDDALTAHLTRDGQISWAAGAGWYGNESSWGVAADGQGNAIVAGRFEWSVDFDAITLGAAGGDDIFVAKYGPGGKVLWAVSAGGNEQDWGWAVAPDGTGGAYVTGFFGGLAHFGSTTVDSEGSSDLFVTRHSAAGQQMWVAAAGGPGGDRGYDVARNGEGVLVTGYFAQSMTLGSTTLAAQGAQDIFIARLTGAGAWDWALSGGGTEVDRPSAMALGPGRTLYLTGQYAGSATLGGATLQAQGGDDIFVWKVVLP